jgi:hypothetical protein
MTHDPLCSWAEHEEYYKKMAILTVGSDSYCQTCDLIDKVRVDERSKREVES